MKIFNRFRVSFKAGVENLLDHVENHEAAADAVIVEARKGLAKAEVRANRLRTETKKLTLRVDEQTVQAATWSKRALAVQATDKKTALECLRRKKQAETEKTRLQGDLDEHKALLAKLEAKISDARSRIDEMVRQRSTLAAREGCSAAVEQTRLLDEDVETSRVFERWEERVLSKEITADVGSEPVDTLSEQFESDETDAELEAELKALIASEEPEDNDDDNNNEANKES